MLAQRFHCHFDFAQNLDGRQKTEGEKERGGLKVEERKEDEDDEEQLNRSLSNSSSGLSFLGGGVKKCGTFCGFAFVWSQQTRHEAVTTGGDRQHDG